MKKLVFTLLIALIYSVGFAQTFHIDSLPKKGILLDKGWKWHAGDNPDFAKKDFDDSKWESIDPTLVIPELKSTVSNQPIWLRLKFKSSTIKNNFFISVKQSGATEIYLNNRIIHAFGMIDTSNDKIQSYDPNGGYISLPIDTTENILAIKYYFEKGVRYKSVFDVRYPLFSARIFSEKAVLESDKNRNAFIWEGFNLGFPLILFVVHFIIFLFYMPFRANLWYSLWALFNFISAYFLLQIKIEHNITFKNDYSLYAAVLGGLGNLSLIYSLFLLLRQNNKRLLGIFFSITILSIFSFLSEYKLNFIIDFSFSLIFVLLVIYMAYSAYKQGNIGGKYVIYSMVLYLITWVLFIFSYEFFFSSEWISAILFHIAVFCLPMTMSILLGIDFRNIHKNFIDVTLEKQHILTTQNETLEKQVHERTAELEHKNRDLEIEAALERVRSRTMAMHKSEEVLETANVLYQELKKLGFQFGGVIIIIMDEATGDMEHWFSGFDQENYPQCYRVPYFEHPFYEAQLNGWRNGETYKVIEIGGELKKSYDQNMFSRTDYIHFPEQEKQWMRASESVLFSFAYMKHGALMWGPTPISEDEALILQRFAKVFEQTYTRFLDLQKAEVQAREAQIEVALERVRSRTMAMQKSENLIEVINEVAVQLLQLNFRLDTASFFLNNESEEFTFWLAAIGESNPNKIIIPKLQHPVLNNIKQAQKKGLDFFADTLTFEEKNAWFQHVFDHSAINRIPEDRKKYLLNTEGYARSVVLMKHIGLFIVNFVPQPYNDDENTIFKRFAFAFEQAYVRFLDLQKAEEQAREAQIEVALERVRSRTMAMQHSNELQEAATLLFQQVQTLGIPVWSCGYNIWEKEEKVCTGWMSSEGILPPPFKIPLTESPTFIHFYDSRQKRETFYVEKVEGESLIAHYEYMRNLPVFGAILNEFLNAGFVLPPSQIHHVVNFSHGNLIFITVEPVPEAWDIFKRFAKVFEQTYTRFLDLQKAETQALEALQLSSVDRVRAEIASMRTTGDLERITPLIWNELTTLGVPFIRCGVFIMDEEQEQIHTFLSTPDGKAIASFNTSFSNPGLLTEALPHWRNKEIYKTHWDEATFLAQAKTLIEQGAILSPEKYLTESRPTGLYLHFLPFLQGMLYVGNDTAPLTDDQLKLVQTLADAFSAAYARYEDFNKLELAKKQVESTLSELKTTQTQLIQKEKLASLGELTAGIAHEIQNPLNFVNNFSELSVELIEELKVERAKVKEVRDEELENELLNDLAQNQEKINHHGKRASSIVKGMLEHSRQSTGERTLTDINQLADEYLRLSYHGLRAKDNSFNADFELIADADLPKIEVIPQDIGRVLLNLINNAFYAVNKRTKNEKPDYQPKVTIATNYSPIGGWEAIRVKDNGIGMSEATKAKIFQPFFTTKPTGEGTGLGLSLAYDIITKGHGGTIKVESTEGEGTTFVVTLPLGK